MKAGGLVLLILIITITGCTVCPPPGPWPTPPGCSEVNNNIPVSNNNSLGNNTSVSNNNTINNSTVSVPVLLTNYTFYLNVPLSTPVNDTIYIAFFSDVSWELWKPMTKINTTYWMFSMPAGWLPSNATKISYGFLRNDDWAKTELLLYTNNSFWVNRTFTSNREYGFNKVDTVKSWKDIITRSIDENISGTVHAIVPLDTTRVTLTTGNNSYELSKVKDFYYHINVSLIYNSSFTLTAYNNTDLINSDNFLFTDEVFAYVSEPEIGRDLMKGYSFSACHYCQVSFTRGNYLEHLNNSYEIMKSEGTDWISFNPVWFLTDIYSSDLRPIYREEYGIDGWSGWMQATIPDEEVRLIIRFAHEKGLKVFLMPHLSTLNWSETIPGKGNLAPVDVNAFFSNYTNFQLHYARIAEEEGVELYSIGNELDSITDESNGLSTGYSKTAKWYEIINAVRSVYHGNLTYSCSCTNNDNNECTPEKIKFWDKLDYIGFEWYIPLSSNRDATMTELINSAKQIIDSKIKPLSAKYNKPVLFTEYGWEAKPYAWTNTYTGGGQGGFDKYAAVVAYEAVFQAIKNEPVTAGMFNAWPLGNIEHLNYIKDYNGVDVRFSIIESEIAKWYTWYK